MNPRIVAAIDVVGEAKLLYRLRYIQSVAANSEIKKVASEYLFL